MSRKGIREAWGAILRASLTADDDSIYAGQPTALDGASPIIIVASAGTDRTGGTADRSKATFGGGVVPMFDLDIYVYVLATADADDLLDTIEDELNAAVERNQKHSLWTAVVYRGPTQTKFLEVQDGTQYKYEIAPLRFTGR